VLPLDVVLGRSNTPLELLKLVRLVRIRRLTDNAKSLSMVEVLKSQCPSHGALVKAPL